MWSSAAALFSCHLRHVCVFSESSSQLRSAGDVFSRMSRYKFDKQHGCPATSAPLLLLLLLLALIFYFNSSHPRKRQKEARSRLRLAFGVNRPRGEAVKPAGQIEAGGAFPPDTCFANSHVKVQTNKRHFKAKTNQKTKQKILFF